MEKTTAQKSVRQFFFVVAGNDDNRPRPRLDQLLGFLDEKFHTVEFLQQVIREFDVGFVDFID